MTFEVEKRFEISAAHQLKLDYESKCSRKHGHNWEISVICERETLDENGMVFDFGKIKEVVSGILDHRDITHLIVVEGKEVNPTAENICLFIAQTIGETCKSVKVKESDGNTASWRR